MVREEGCACRIAEGYENNFSTFAIFRLSDITADKWLCNAVCRAFLGFVPFCDFFALNLA